MDTKHSECQTSNELLTYEECLNHKKGTFLNTDSGDMTTKREMKRAITKFPDLKEILFRGGKRFIVQTNTKRWDKATQKMRSHESSCEFGKNNCSCWCNDEYHGIRTVIV